MFLLPEKTVRLHMGFRGVGELYWIGDITDFMYHIRKLSVKMFATCSRSDQVKIPDCRYRTWFQTRNFLFSTLSSVNYLCLCSAIDWGIPRVRLYPAILTRFTLECRGVVLQWKTVELSSLIQMGWAGPHLCCQLSACSNLIEFAKRSKLNHKFQFLNKQD